MKKELKEFSELVICLIIAGASLYYVFMWAFFGRNEQHLLIWIACIVYFEINTVRRKLNQQETKP